MKRMTALAFLAATFISMSCACAHAQTVEFKVPFDFSVGNQVLPAGTYGISRVTGKVILIRSQDLRFHTLVVTNTAYKQSNVGGKAIFTRYGNQYFLHEVLCSGLGMNMDLPTSTLEKRAHLQEARLAGGQTVAALQVGGK